ncbi:MAG: GbsR/MarR family transcriptional regulator [Hasllibacter sp.]
MSAPPADARAAFIETVGLIGQADGMPRIAGRLFGLMLFDDRERAFGELADELEVSRGSISSAVRLLEERGLIRRTARPGERGDFFALEEDPFPSLLRAARERQERAARRIAESLDALPAGADGPRARVGDYLAFYRAITAGLDHALTRLEPGDEG